MWAILRQRNFGLLWTGGLISEIGDWVLMVALPFEIYRRTGSTLATGGMVLTFLIPRILIGSVAGVFVDRWDRRRLMITVDLLLAGCLLPLLAIDSVGLWIAYLVLVIESILEQLFMPAKMALLPNLLVGGPAELVTANALTGVGRHLARLIGPAVGGLIVAFGGLTAVTIVDSVSFLVSASMVALIRVAPDVHHLHAGLEEETVSAWRKLVGEWRDGLAVIAGDRILRAILAFSIITAIGEGLTSTLFVPWVKDWLHAGSAGYGAVLSTQAIGGVAGALVIGRYGARLDPLRLLIGGALLFGAIDLVLFTYPVLYPVLAPALVGMVIVGVPGAAMGAALTTLQQSRAEDRQRGRVFGAIGAVAGFGALVGVISAAVLGEVVPVVLLLVVQGSGYVIAGLVVWYMTRSRMPAVETSL